MKFQLSIAIVANPRTWPILDGTVKPDGIDLICSPGNPGEIFVAEVKTGDEAPRMSTAATRRQLLEYHVAFDVDGVLLVCPELGTIQRIEFPQLRT